MPSSNSLLWTPDVFVSFENNDDKVKRFTSILFTKLKQAGIGYRDSRKRGDALIIAIRQSRFALVVFSANYCDQRLDDLVEILLHRGNSKYPSLVVIPIFYGIEPTEALKLQITGEVKKALKKLPEHERDVKEREWRRALAKVEGIPGYCLKKDANDDGELIKKIFERLVNEIRSLYSFKVFGPFGGRSKKPWHSNEINGIQILFMNSIKSVTFKVHPGNSTHEHEGKDDGKDPYKVKLHEREDIISFHGHFKKENGYQFETLRFRTTRRRDLGVGRIDEERVDYFSVPLPSGAGKVIEFFGSESGDGFLTSIGARVELTRDVYCPVELFGGRRGTSWDAGRHTTVKGIRALRDSSGNRCIRSIAFRFDEDEWWWPPGSDKQWHMEFKIDDPNEYLSSISGYNTNDGIASLTFLTNKRNTVTIGDGKGTHFSFPKTGYEIVGFHGWSDEHILYGIGAYIEPIPNLRQVKSIGPFGGAIAWDDGEFKGVKEIRIYISNDNDIRYIKIVYVDNSGNDCPIIHGDHTKQFPKEEESIKLNYPKEYLTWISGYKRDDGSIQSLTFHSNRKKQEFGTSEGLEWGYFGYPSNKSQIIGFYGTFGKTLNSIGVYEKPIQNWTPSKHEPDGFIRSGGDYWEDEEHYNVVGYRVTQSGSSNKSEKIESITFMYEKNGSLVEGPPRGGGDPSSGEWVMLNYPKERLERISGYWRKEEGETIIHDLEIVTTDNGGLPYATRGELYSNSKSKAKSKPEPESKESKLFIIPKISDEVRPRIVGFFGYAKTSLNFIGAHLEPYED